MSEMTLRDIEAKAKTYADRRQLLKDCLVQVEKEMQVVKDKYLKDLKRRVKLVSDYETELREAIEAAPDLFEKPKTRIFHGIKVGYRKGPGALDWEDDEDLVRKIEKYFPDEAETYLLIKKKPKAEALEDLDAATLKRLGVQVGDNEDQVVIKPVESDIERLVKALLKGAQDEAEDAA